MLSTWTSIETNAWTGVGGVEDHAVHEWMGMGMDINGDGLWERMDVRIHLCSRAAL